MRLIFWTWASCSLSESLIAGNCVYQPLFIAAICMWINTDKSVSLVFQTLIDASQATGLSTSHSFVTLCVILPCHVSPYWLHYWFLSWWNRLAETGKQSDFLQEEKEQKQIWHKLWASQNALCMQHRYLFRVRQQWDEIRNNDPLQPVIKQLGFVCSVQPQAELLWSAVSADWGSSHTDMLTAEPSPALCIWCDDVENVAHSRTQHPLCRYIFTPFNINNWPPSQCKTWPSCLVLFLLLGHRGDTSFFLRPSSVHF